jgi:hypothetical protein
MRAALTHCASADAATTMHRFGSSWGPLRPQRLVAPRAGVRFAVPGWTPDRPVIGWITPPRTPIRISAHLL